MTHPDLVLQMAQYLDAVGIPFMIAGSVCSSQWSLPRSTNDVDIVIEATPAQIEQLFALLGSGFYSSLDMAREGLAHESMFNVIDYASGLKVDLIPRKSRPFDVEQFQRRISRPLKGRQVPIATAEDIILANETRSRPPNGNCATFRKSPRRNGQIWTSRTSANGRRSSAWPWNWKTFCRSLRPDRRGRSGKSKE